MVLAAADTQNSVRTHCETDVVEGLTPAMAAVAGSGSGSGGDGAGACGGR